MAHFPLGLGAAAAATAAAAAAACTVTRWCARARRHRRAPAGPPAAGRHPTPRLPVVIVTDIAKDIDDTVALMYIAGLVKAGTAEVVGVVCTGGSERKRQAVAEELLRDLGMAGKSDDGGEHRPVEVVAGHPTRVDGTLFPNAEVVTHGFVSDEDHGDGQNDGKQTTPTASDAIAAWCFDLHPVLICLGPVTDVALALRKHGSRLLARGVGAAGVLVQGQIVEADVERAVPKLAPCVQAYNLRADMDAARVLFDAIAKEEVPFVALGKHAAYQVPMTLEDVDALDAAAKGILRWSVKDLVLSTLIEFVRDPNAADVLERAYHVSRETLLSPPDIADAALAERIVARLPHLTVPYDVLCCMCIHLLPGTHETSQRQSMGGGVPPVSQLLPADPPLAAFPHVMTIGNSPGRAQKVDAAAVKRMLLHTCRAGLQ